MLHIENLSAGYGDVAVLQQIDLEVGPNEVVGVLGCNGAGKTTLVKAIMGLLPRVNGDVLFQGQSITGLRTHAIARRGIGLVPQGRWIFPKLTVRENTPLPKLAAADAQLGHVEQGTASLHVQFPAGTGYVDETVTLTW